MDVVRESNLHSQHCRHWEINVVYKNCNFNKTTENNRCTHVMQITYDDKTCCNMRVPVRPVVTAKISGGNVERAEDNQRNPNQWTGKTTFSLATYQLFSH